ncbi:inositol 1,4,5-trisphosphate receptor-interacting protein [Leuresthes tenuis]|uniref:inositol 1,4,5-trisphosphate receptor-interacting protein n=1 Tax=Leuresthes tenuis TaxID=355514 RepID=UPI003B50F097
MMQEMLRVFVVALGLLMCPRDDPGIEEWDDIVAVSLQKHEERLLRGEEKLDQVIAPAREKTTQSDKGPEDDINNIPEDQNQSDQHVIRKDKMSGSNVTVFEQDGIDYKLPEGHFIDESDPSLPEKYHEEPESAMKTSQITHEENGKDILTDSSTKEPGRPQGKHRMPEEKEMFSSKEPETPLSHIQTKTESETSKKTISEWEKEYLWYIWNTFSIFSLIRFLKKFLIRNSQTKREVTRAFPVICTADEVSLPSVDTLQHFHAKCVKVSNEKKWRKDEFLEGFANDLLEAMRTICDKDCSMVIEDFQMVNTCDIIVYFNPPEPYEFQCLFWNNRTNDPLLDTQFRAQIKLVEGKKISNGCPCQSSDADDDMVCLLHSESEIVKTKIVDVCDGPLCSRSTPLLSKSQVTRWFQGTLKQAWALISHKYEFEVNIRYIEAPGALVIRFRSGKKISVTINPVVKFSTDAHFFIAPWSPKDLDTFWTLSLTIYEDRLLELLSKRLPENSCHNQTLDIARFLHKRQTALSGSTALKDFHYKAALLHLLLLNKKPSTWGPDNVAFRLRDLLAFMEKSLEKKLLNHVLIGNPLTEIIELPTEFTKAKPVNLFHPLVVHNCIYKNAVMHFQEMLRNAHMLIDEHVAQHT